MEGRKWNPHCIPERKVKEVKMSALPKFISGTVLTETLTWCSFFQNNVKVGKIVQKSKSNLTRVNHLLDSAPF